MTRIALIGGMGYPVTESAAGLPALKQRLKASGIDTGAGPFSHTDRQSIKDWLHGYKGYRGLIGDSLGAGAAALYASDLDGSVDFVGGFQPSAYDPIAHGPLSHREIVVPANVRVAHCIRNPWWVETVGLGYAYYVTLPKAKTILTTTERQGAHPDDWGYSQNLMVTHLLFCIKGHGALGEGSG